MRDRSDRSKTVATCLQWAVGPCPALHPHCASCTTASWFSLTSTLYQANFFISAHATAAINVRPLGSGTWAHRTFQINLQHATNPILNTYFYANRKHCQTAVAKYYFDIYMCNNPGTVGYTPANTRPYLFRIPYTQLYYQVTINK